MILSIVALIISLAVAVFEYKWNWGINTYNENRDFINNVFGTIMFNELPEARELITIKEGKFEDIDKIESVLRKIRNRGLCFKRINKSFYEELVKKVQDIEDYLMSNEKKANTDELVHKYNKVDEKIADLYSFIYKINFNK